MNSTELVQKLLKKYSVNTVKEFLEANIQPSDIQWFFIELSNNIVKRVTASSLLKKHKESRFTRPCDVSPKDFAKFEAVVYEKMPANYIPLELSPVMSLGSNAILANTSQGNVLSTARTLEVAADTTMALTIEAATRLLGCDNTQATEGIYLCANQRCLRLQGTTDDYGFTPHFKILALCGAWRKQDNTKTKIYDNLNQQIGFYLDLIEECRNKGFQIGKVIVEISDINAIEQIIRTNNLDRGIIRSKINDTSFNLVNLLPCIMSAMVCQITNREEKMLLSIAPSNVLQCFKELEKNILSTMSVSHPAVEFVIDLGRIAGIGYYNGPCFKIYGEAPDGKIFPLADGGVSDWVAKLLSDGRWQVCTSGFGSELFCRNFK